MQEKLKKKGVQQLIKRLQRYNVCKTIKKHLFAN